MEIQTIVAQQILPGEYFEVPGHIGGYRMEREVHRDGTAARYRVAALPAGNPFHLVLSDWQPVKVAR